MRRGEFFRRLLRSERGYTLMELLTVMVIMGIVMGSLTTLFVQGSTAEARTNNRFQAQVQGRIALDSLRREVHCASAVTATAGWTNTVTLTLPAQCPTGSGSVSWCTVSGGTNRYKLYRQTGATCSASGTFKADYLTKSAAFNYTASVTGVSLAKLSVDIAVNPTPSKAIDTWELADDIVLRNSSR